MNKEHESDLTMPYVKVPNATLDTIISAHTSMMSNFFFIADAPFCGDFGSIAAKCNIIVIMYTSHQRRTLAFLFAG